ncbi:hypothetical protein LOK49_LG02G01053 [Camellia lanceoleosa]|uniref:Uncharacterized protein n=1 Tax=Camellia lanceoleosa TaxID=1840588 RepID=A0ACC0IG37_9ERIC|nr:hypothetical protein LOK49_LG02G01053 [Camellia lanceoleosa]
MEPRATANNQTPKPTMEIGKITLPQSLVHKMEGSTLSLLLELGIEAIHCRHSLVDRTDNGENRTKLEHHSRASSALVSYGIHEPVYSSHHPQGGLKIGFFLQSMLVPIQQPGTNLWEELERTTNTMTQPWLVARDFNDFTDLSERKSFSLNHNFTKSQRFRDRINKCNLIDLGSVGPRLTWTNNRQGLANTMERLDKAMTNDQ